MIVTALLQEFWIQLLFLVPWLVGLALALRHWRDGGWAKVAAGALAVLLVAGALGIAREWWFVGHLSADAPLSPPSFLTTWGDPLLMLIQLLGFCALVTSLFLAGLGHRAERTSLSSEAAAGEG